MDLGIGDGFEIGAFIAWLSKRELKGDRKGIYLFFFFFFYLKELFVRNINNCVSRDRRRFVH